MYLKLAMAVIGLLISFNALGHDKDHNEAINQTTIYMPAKAIDDGVAMGIAASQHHFDISTYKLQGSLAAGQYGGRTAVSYGMAKRMCKSCILLNGSIGMAGNKKAVGIGGSWKF